LPATIKQGREFLFLGAGMFIIRKNLMVNGFRALKMMCLAFQHVTERILPQKKMTKDAMKSSAPVAVARASLSPARVRMVNIIAEMGWLQVSDAVPMEMGALVRFLKAYPRLVTTVWDITQVE